MTHNKLSNYANNAYVFFSQYLWGFPRIPSFPDRKLSELCCINSKQNDLSISKTLGNKNTLSDIMIYSYGVTVPCFSVSNIYFPVIISIYSCLADYLRRPWCWVLSQDVFTKDKDKVLEITIVSSLETSIRTLLNLLLP